MTQLFQNIDETIQRFYHDECLFLDGGKESTNAERLQALAKKYSAQLTRSSARLQVARGIFSSLSDASKSLSETTRLKCTGAYGELLAAECLLKEILQKENSLSAELEMQSRRVFDQFFSLATDAAREGSPIHLPVPNPITFETFLTTHVSEGSQITELICGRIGI